MSFDGVQGRVSLGSSFQTYLSGNKTISLWFKKIGTGGSYSRLFGADRDAGPADFRGINITMNNSSNAIYGSIAAADGLKRSTTSVTINNDVRYHAVVIHDMTNNLASFYLDGEKIGSDVIVTGYRAATWVDVNIGRYGGAAQYFKGDIDDVRVYDHALNSGEIKDIYLSTSQRATGDCLDSSGVYHPLTKRYKDADNDGYSDGTMIEQCSTP